MVHLTPFRIIVLFAVAVRLMHQAGLIDQHGRLAASLPVV